MVLVRGRADVAELADALDLGALYCTGCASKQHWIESSLYRYADVVELADTPDLGSGARKGIGVQVSSSAHHKLGFPSSVNLFI